jgi:phenylacetate-CoA ligase
MYNKQGILESVARRFPLWVRYPLGFFCIGIIEPFKCGYLKYRNFNRFLEKSQWWSKERLERYQMGKLKPLLEHACKNVPYYKNMCKKMHLTPDDFNSIRDLEKFPLLTKEDVVNNFSQLIAENISLKQKNKRLDLRSTSGSTGKPMFFYRDKNYRFIKKSLFRWRNRVAGLRENNKCIHLWSYPFVEDNLDSLFLYAPYDRKLIISTANIELNYFKKYLELFRSFKPKYVIGPPSFLYLLACYVDDKGEKGIKFPVFFSTTENLLSFHRKAIERCFRCEIFNVYHSEEDLVSAVECQKHEGMHIMMQKGVVEIVNENGKLSKEGQRGRIICTGLNNYVMPFIRYEIGDIGTVSYKRCSCGRGLPLLKKLAGRTSEMLNYNNMILDPAALSIIVKSVRNIKECQFVQETSNLLKINIVKRKGYVDKDLEEFIGKIKELIGNEVKVNLCFLDKIPRTRMGKFRFVINRLREKQNV